MVVRNTVIEELSLREMLADSIVKAVMARDGITARDVARVLWNARARIAGKKRKSEMLTAGVAASLLPVDNRQQWMSGAKERGLQWNH
jgi:hypothetical protein